jgi:hypothetical protein
MIRFRLSARQAVPPGATAPGSANPPVGATGDCDSVTTCYTPHRLQVAYGIEPLLKRGIDGRGETVVFPELAEPQLSRLWSATCARTWRNLTAYSACPPRGYGS